MRNYVLYAMKYKKQATLKNSKLLLVYNILRMISKTQFQIDQNRKSAKDKLISFFNRLTYCLAKKIN